ncbi:MAG TPA: P-loop NTPase fold protein [Acidimicrobiia bacterium]|nr:P-loop NTPase fold protein [Acidimicrobiia bacterium]
MSLPGDNPIIRTEDDALSRADVARSFADQVLALDVSEGVVVGVLGAWGAGKTSFLNLARPHLVDAGATVLEFNPWMFSGAQQLVDSFFVEVSAQLKVRRGMAAIADDLQDYGEAFSGLAWLPLVGPWIERGRGAAKILGTLPQRRKEGISSRREKLLKALRALTNPLVVVLDDIDRLTTPEIRDVFKLVRLTASFPNVVYVLVFDRARVESALTDAGVPGRDYLEKILQLAVDLPAIPPALLDRQVSQALDIALSDIDNPGPFNEHAWPDLFVEIVRPLVRNMRDVRRYTGSIQGTVKALEGEIALADVLALEAIRVFLPDSFALFQRSIDGLTTTSDSFGGFREPPHLKAVVDALIESAPRHEDVLRAMIERLFPAALRHTGGSHYGADWKTTWLRERRVASEAIFRLYLERVPGRQLQALLHASHAWELMADESALEEFLRSLDPGQLEDVISGLENYETEFQPKHVVPGTVALLNLLPELPERPRGMFDISSRLVVGRVVYRLLRSLESQADLVEAVRDILPQLTKLSSKLEVIMDIGHREGAGHRLVTEEAAAEFERGWRAQVRSAPVEHLVNDREVLKIFLVAQRYAEADEAPVELADSPELTLALLRASRSEVRSQLIGNRAVRRSFRLAWDALVEVFGGENVLRLRFESLKTAALRIDDGLVEEVEKYLSGWRPDDE